MQTPGTIRHFTYYFKRMMKFYELKVQGVPQVLFILLLAVSFGMRVVLQPFVAELSIYQQQLMNTYKDVFTNPLNMEALMKIPYSEEYIQMITLMFRIMGLLAIQQIIMMLMAFFYLGAYLSDLEGSEVSLKLYMSKFIRAMPRFIGFSLLFYIAAGMLFVVLLLLTSMMALIVPIMYFLIVIPFIGWFIIQVIFIFKDITFLDTGVGIFRNFGLTWKLTEGNRFMVGRNIIFIVFLNVITGMVTVGSNVLLSLFVISFLEIIVLLIRQRLITMMYISRTRKENTLTKTDAD